MVAGYTVHTENLQLLRKISKVAFKNQLVNGAFFLYNFMDRWTDKCAWWGGS